MQFFDRSPLCTLALARYLGRPVTRPLAEEVVRVAAERVFEPTVFLVRPLEAVHEAVYQEHCYALVDVHGGPVAERREFVQSVVSRPLAERSGTA